MHSLLKRTVILTFSRLANQAIVLISPVVLVRILSVAEYGSYREFMLYAVLASSIALLGIPQSLAYFIPRYPDKERVWITQTALFLLAASSAVIILISIFSDLLRANTSFDFVAVIQLYIFFVVNLDFVEYYWLGKKRTDYVLFYSTGRLVVRLSVVVIVAWATRDSYSIVVALIVVEAIRFIFVLLFGFFNHWFTTAISKDYLGQQMSYFIPLGGGGLLEVLNTRIGMLFVSTAIGPEALAFYTIGALATQIVNILRGAIADVIFPEILELREKTLKDSLPLWRRATVWYCILIFPFAALFAYYADVVVIVLFTADYAPAIPIFSVFAFALYFHCFDFHLPLRVQNANRYFMAGSGLALVFNVALLYPTYNTLGIIGPALAYIFSRVIYSAYLARQVARIYSIKISELAHWKEVGKIFIASVVGIPVLVAGAHLVENLFLRGVIFGSVYLSVYLIILLFFGVTDVKIILKRMVLRS